MLLLARMLEEMVRKQGNIPRRPGQPTTATEKQLEASWRDCRLHFARLPPVGESSRHKENTINKIIGGWMLIPRTIWFIEDNLENYRCPTSIKLLGKEEKFGIACQALLIVFHFFLGNTYQNKYTWAYNFLTTNFSDRSALYSYFKVIWFPGLSSLCW